MPATINRFLSQKLRFYTFVSIVLLLWVHGYNLQETYLQPFTTVKESLTFTTFIEYFFANGILRFRIPLLFIISGFIYASKEERSYPKQIGRRARTLLVPYIFWSTVGILITWLWQQYPATAQAVFDAHIDQLGDNRPYNEIGWHGVLFRWVFAPIAFQVWFILSLFIYDLIYPFIKWVLQHYAAAWFALTFILSAGEVGFWVFDGRGLFFFSLGIWLVQIRFNVERKPAWLSLYIAWLFFIGFSVIKTFMAFELGDGKVTFWVLTILHTVSVLCGILAVWFGGDAAVRWCMRKPWFVWATAFSFFIFGLHAPLVIYLSRLLFLYFDYIPDYRLLTYLVAPAITLMFCIGAGALVRAVAPGLYRLSTGGRGY